MPETLHKIREIREYADHFSAVRWYRTNALIPSLYIFVLGGVDLIANYVHRSNGSIPHVGEANLGRGVVIGAILSYVVLLWITVLNDKRTIDDVRRHHTGNIQRPDGAHLTVIASIILVMIYGATIYVSDIRINMPPSFVVQLYGSSITYGDVILPISVVIAIISSYSAYMILDFSLHRFIEDFATFFYDGDTTHDGSE